MFNTRPVPQDWYTPEQKQANADQLNSVLEKSGWRPTDMDLTDRLIEEYDDMMSKGYAWEEVIEYFHSKPSTPAFDKFLQEEDYNTKKVADSDYAMKLSSIHN